MSTFCGKTFRVLVLFSFTLSALVSTQAATQFVETFDGATTIFTKTYFFHINGRPDVGVFDVDDLSTVTGVPAGLPSLPISAGGDKELRFHQNPVSTSASIYMTLTAAEPILGWSTAAQQQIGGTIAFTQSTAGWSGGLVLRAQDGGSYTLVNGYIASVSVGTPGQLTLSIYRLTAGVNTAIAESTLSAATDDNVRVEFEANGTALTARFYRLRRVAGQIDESLLSTLTATDSTYTSGSAAGIVAYLSGAPSVLFDNIVIGAVNAPPPSVNPPLVSQQFAVGSPVQVTATASNTEEYQWFKDGTAIVGATTNTLSFATFQPGDRGFYSVRLNGPGGVAFTPAIELHLQPLIRQQPADAIAVTGSTVALSVDALYAVSYQWLKDGAAIAGATSATLALANIGPADAGGYQVSVIGTGGAVLSAVANVSASPKPSSRLVNLSARSRAGRDDKTLIMGFVVAGSGSKQVLIRGLGPTLVAAGVSDALSDPVLKLYDRSATKLAENDNWGGTTSLRTKFVELGASPLADISKDAALVTSLTGGPYSAHATATDASTGIALVEVYDAALEENARLVNVSVRSETLPGDGTLIAGFVLAGNAPKTLLVRGVGPTLTGRGVAGAIADPQISLYNRQAAKLNENDNWGGTSALKDVFALVGAGPLASDTSKDAALLVTLDPGVYTVHLSGVNNTTGVALVEIFEVP